jgi:hypothetical protein
MTALDELTQLLRLGSYDFLSAGVPSHFRRWGQVSQDQNLSPK